MTYVLKRNPDFICVNILKNKNGKVEGNSKYGKLILKNPTILEDYILVKKIFGWKKDEIEHWFYIYKLKVKK